MTSRNSRNTLLESWSIVRAPGCCVKTRHGGVGPSPGRSRIAIDGALTRRAP